MTWTTSNRNLKQLIAIERERRRRAREHTATERVDPVSWARENAQIVHPARGRISFDPYPYQCGFLSSYYEPRRIILKARQIGFSQAFAIESLYSAIMEAEGTILLVSRSQDLAVNLLRYCYQAYSNLRNAPALRKANESEMGFANGSRIKSIPANRSTGRGFAANRVYLDEFAYAEHADDIYQSVSPAVSQGGYLTIGSTPNGVGNLFHQLYIHGEGFTRMVVPWYRCPAYNPDGHGLPDTEARAVGEAGAWYKTERPKYTHQQFAAEFDCDFVGSGLAIFPLEHLDAAAQGAVGKQEPIAGHKYLTSVDVGRRRDATIINTFDITALPYQRVMFDRLERVPYPVIQSKIDARGRAYPGPLYIESNGTGDPVFENLTVKAIPFVTTARTKVQAIEAAQLLFERGELKMTWDDSRERAALTSAAWDDDHTADEVMSLAIGAAQMMRGATPTVAPIGLAGLSKWNRT